MGDIVFREGSLEDSREVFLVFHAAIADFARRTGLEEAGEEDITAVDREWQQRRSLFEHLGRTAEHFCLAQRGDKTIGYARSILRDGVRELTEFFVLPNCQSSGVGRELLARVFPVEGARRRAIIATTDVRAMVRYLKSGVYARFPIYNFSREPRSQPQSAGVTYEPLITSPEALEAVREIDLAVLGYARDEDHVWWMDDRQGFLFWRGNQLMGYGYSGYDAGPVALLDKTDFPVVLSIIETIASQSVTRIHFEIPLVNQTAVDYLLANGYQISPFIALLMTDEPFGQFDRYILPAPPFVL